MRSLPSQPPPPSTSRGPQPRDGSVTKNLNKTGVRLCTAPSPDEHHEIGGGHALDPFADPADRLARTNQRRRAVDRPVQRRPELPSSNGAFELERHGGQLRGGFDQLTCSCGRIWPTVSGQRLHRSEERVTGRQRRAGVFWCREPYRVRRSEHVFRLTSFWPKLRRPHQTPFAHTGDGCMFTSTSDCGRSDRSVVCGVPLRPSQWT
jgi:hypothetical protein